MPNQKGTKERERLRHRRIHLNSNRIKRNRSGVSRESEKMKHKMRPFALRSKNWKRIPRRHSEGFSEPFREKKRSTVGSSETWYINKGWFYKMFYDKDNSVYYYNTVRFKTFKDLPYHTRHMTVKKKPVISRVIVILAFRRSRSLNRCRRDSRAYS